MFLNFYLILKPLLYLFGTNVISEIGAKVIPFLAQMKQIIGAKSHIDWRRMQNAGLFYSPVTADAILLTILMQISRTPLKFAEI